MDKKLSLKTKIGYGMGMCGECLSMNTFYIYFLLFLTDAVKLNAGAAGTISMIAIFFGSFTDLYVGPKSDNSLNTKGRRRPFILKGAIPLGIMFFLTFTSFDGMGDGIKVVYFMIVAALFWFALSVTDIPCQSFGAEITDDYKEKSSLRGISNCINYLGMCLAGSATLLIVSHFSKTGDIGDAGAWSKTALIYAIIITASYLIVVAATKGHEKPFVPTGNEEKDNFFETCKAVLKIKSFRAFLLYTIFGYGGILLYTSSGVYHLYDVVGMSTGQVSLLMFVSAIMSVVVSPIFGQLKFDKKKVLMVVSFAVGIVFIIAFFVGVTPITVYLLWFCNCCATTVYFVQGYSMVYDVSDVDEYKSGKRREGTIFSIFSFISKFVGGIAMLVIGWMLSGVGYDPTMAVQSAETQTGISLLCLALTGVLYIIGAIFVLGYKINSKNFAALRDAIDKRNKGQSYSEEGFEELLK